jgi:hypothetical protein
MRPAHHPQEALENTNAHTPDLHHRHAHAETAG